MKKFKHLNNLIRELFLGEFNFEEILKLKWDCEEGELNKIPVRILDNLIILDSWNKNREWIKDEFEKKINVRIHNDETKVILRSNFMTVSKTVTIKYWSFYLFTFLLFCIFEWYFFDITSTFFFVLLCWTYAYIGHKYNLIKKWNRSIGIIESLIGGCLKKDVNYWQNASGEF